MAEKSKFLSLLNMASEEAEKGEQERQKKIKTASVKASEDPERSEYSRRTFKGIDKAFNKGK